MNITPQNQLSETDLVKGRFSAALAKQITTKRALIAAGAVIAVSAALPMAILAIQAGLAFLASGVLALAGFFAWRRLPLWIARHENSLAEANQREMNRHLAALKQEAQQSPMDQLQNYLIGKKKQLEAYKSFVTDIGAQVKSIGDMLAQRKKEHPEKDHSKKQEAVVAMQKAYAFHMETVKRGNAALAELTEAVDDAKFDHKFGEVGKAAMQQMKSLQGQDLLNEMLAAESFDAVRTNFNRVFADIEVQVGAISTAEKLDYGSGIVLDVSSLQIPEYAASSAKEAKRV